MIITVQAFWIIYPIIFFSSIAYHLLGKYITYLDQRKFWLVSRRKMCDKLKRMFYNINLVTSMTFLIIAVTDLMTFTFLMITNYLSGGG